MREISIVKPEERCGKDLVQLCKGINIKEGVEFTDWNARDIEENGVRLLVKTGQFRYTPTIGSTYIIYYENGLKIKDIKKEQLC